MKRSKEKALLSLVLVVSFFSTMPMASNLMPSRDPSPPGCLPPPIMETLDPDKIAIKFKSLFDLEPGRVKGTLFIKLPLCPTDQSPFIPFPGVRVSIYWNDLEMARTVTDNDGIFEVEVAPRPLLDIGIFQPYDYAVFFKGVSASPGQVIELGAVITQYRFDPYLVRIVFQEGVSEEEAEEILFHNCLMEKSWEDEQTVIAKIEDDSHMSDVLQRLAKNEKIEMAQPADFFPGCEP